jgi:hypothetical protein
LQAARDRKAAHRQKRGCHKRTKLDMS